jgi:hypothetical protein
MSIKHETNHTIFESPKTIKTFPRHHRTPTKSHHGKKRYRPAPQTPIKFTPPTDLITQHNIRNLARTYHPEQPLNPLKESQYLNHRRAVTFPNEPLISNVYREYTRNNMKIYKYKPDRGKNQPVSLHLISCTECGFTCKTTARLKAHREFTAYIQCSHCGTWTHSLMAMDKHISTNHNKYRYNGDFYKDYDDFPNDILPK